MMKNVYVVRHCRADGQEPHAKLTELGMQQAEKLSEFLLDKDIDCIISSPFERYYRTIASLAEQIGIKVVLDKPDNTITREEMVIMLSRIVNLNSVDKDTKKGNFYDLNNSYAINEIKAEAQAGIISGKGDGRFDPKSNATRAEALQIILNALKLNPELKTLLDSLI